MPPPLYPPSPGACFFRGGTQRKGGRRGPYDTPIFPASSPTSPSQVPAAPGATWAPAVERWGGQVQGTNELILTTPINAPVPTRTTPEHSQPVTILSKSYLAERTGAVRVGAGAWGVEPSPTQAHPSSNKGAPLPLACEGGQSDCLCRNLGGVAVGNGEAAQSRGFRPGLWFLHSPPRPPPPPPSSCTPLLHIPVKGRAEVRCRKTEGRGEGLGAHHSGGLVEPDLVPLAFTPRAGKVARRRLKRDQISILKWVPNLG